MLMVTAANLRIVLVPPLTIHRHKAPRVKLKRRQAVPLSHQQRPKAKRVALQQPDLFLPFVIKNI